MHINLTHLHLVTCFFDRFSSNLLLICYSLNYLVNIYNSLGSLNRIHDEFHHLLEYKGSLPHTPVNKLLKRSRFFRNALVSLYLSFGLFSLASLLGGLTVQWNEVYVKIVMILTCLGILIIVFASYELIRESLLSWDIIKEHSEEANRKS